MRHCLTCQYEPIWTMIGRTSDMWEVFVGRCSAPKAKCDRRSEIILDAEYMTCSVEGGPSIDTCPAWRPKEK
jgi:hypothetical protein